RKHSKLSELSLPGIDINVGLNITQNKEALYLRLLKKFKDGEKDFEHKFNQAYASNDLKTMERLAHTLKGVAANMGAKNVQYEAQKLEVLCQNFNLTEINEQFRLTLIALTSVLSGLEQLDNLE
ncbi:hypothetical protein CJF42_18735, partial [Pseudoalteromonas sp. NBT06-2]|uniref:Hpt domain-containing protein n=1 Tax=Pseudoalteromonas sp. NBT06-2 TaxID=2025950 RepID=UPI000BD99CDD